MHYEKIETGIFLERPNRFVALVQFPDGRTEVVHVKNTGRCREILIPGCEVYLAYSGNEGRRTRYDLIAAVKKGDLLINIDSQAPNVVMGEWLGKQDYTFIKPEYSYGGSRLDFYLERGSEKYLVEVKGCTLEVDGVGYFPDAPTLRGVKHLKELSQAVAHGYHGVLAFVIQMEGISEVRPNEKTHPEFAQVFHEAENAGVEIWFMLCQVEPSDLHIISRIKKS